VSDLARTAECALIAWVDGTRRYATKVIPSQGELSCECTCPYEHNCKHAEAVVLEYLDWLKHNQPVPLSPPDDARMELLEEYPDEEGLDLDDSDDDDEELPHGKNSDEESLTCFLEEKTKAELVQLIWLLVERHAGLREDILDRKRLEKGQAKPIVKRLRYLIREASAEPGWQDYWRRDGFTPDYSEVWEKLKELLDAGHADEVLALGKELMATGQDLVGRSDDDGQSAAEIGSCMPVIEEALHESSMPAVEKLTWVIDRLKEDEYDLFAPLTAYLNRRHATSDWSELADILRARLTKFKSSRTEKFSRDFERDNLSDWLIRALREAGREDEITPLCEKEALITNSYPRLVRVLMESKRFKEAERWIVKGIHATEHSLFGTASDLRSKLLEILRRRRDFAAVAALLADEFVRAPGEGAYAECRRAAEKLKLWPQVRTPLLAYLETGIFPWTSPDWPLPKIGTEIPEGSDRRSFPRYEALIEIAIAEKQPDQVIHWYDRATKRGFSRYSSLEDRVAEAVSETHPDRAAAVWKKMAERRIDEVKSKSYQQAAAYLRKLKKLLVDTRRTEEWHKYLAGLRTEHARKRLLLSVLDPMDSRPIIKGR
jgi:uncharacterized Zn finger protein